jgi:hypothetical protein
MKAADEYRTLGYTVLRGAISDREVSHLYQYTLKNVDQGNMDDGQVPGSSSFYQDQEMVRLQTQLLPQFEELLQLNLIPVFTYHRIYRKGAILRSHKDGTRAEISASINLGQEGAPWDLWLLDYDENPHKITLMPGDALLYNGVNLCHWRGKLVHSDYVSQVMLHFVDRKGKNVSAARAEIFLKIRKKLFGGGKKKKQSSI